VSTAIGLSPPSPPQRNDAGEPAYGQSPPPAMNSEQRISAAETNAG
jgi:hypothetical protein